MGSFDIGRELGQRAINATLDMRMQKERENRLRQEFLMERQMKQGLMEAEAESKRNLGGFMQEMKAINENPQATSADLRKAYNTWIPKLQPRDATTAKAAMEVNSNSKAMTREALDGMMDEQQANDVYELTGKRVHNPVIRERLLEDPEAVSAWRSAKGGLPYKDGVIDVDKIQAEKEKNLKIIAETDPTAMNAKANLLNAQTRAAESAEKDLPDDMIESLTPDYWYSPSRQKYYRRAKDEKGLPNWYSETEVAGDKGAATDTSSGPGLIDAFKKWTTASE